MRVEAVVAGKHLQNSPVVTSFAETDAQKVLRGRDGFLFLHNDTNAVQDQVQGRRRLTPSELDAWAGFFLELDAAAAARGRGPSISSHPTRSASSPSACPTASYSARSVRCGRSRRWWPSSA
jgi:hypothetical protein